MSPVTKNVSFRDDGIIIAYIKLEEIIFRLKLEVFVAACCNQ